MLKVVEQKPILWYNTESVMSKKATAFNIRRTREFVAKEITPYAAEMDRENHAREGLMEKAADMGLLNVVVPEEYGGMGLDSVTVAVIYEELGKGCAGVATSIAANSLASYPILLAGTEEQKKAHCDLFERRQTCSFCSYRTGRRL